ncbi:MAG: type II toxin-antitoxin system prevent-host-death family antitoxin [Pararhizobium sp.]
MRQFSTVELLRDIKTVTMAADRQPVAITQHRKPRYVLMTYEEFENMAGKVADPRKVFGPGETPAAIAEMILPALDELIEAGKTADDQ